MTISEAKHIIATTNSPHLKRDMEKFIRRSMKKGVSLNAERGASQQSGKLKNIPR